MVHILPQEGRNRLGCIDRRTRKRFSDDDAAVRGDFADAHECHEGLLEIYVPVREPIWAYLGLIEGVGAGYGDVSSRLSGQEHSVEVEEILVRADVAE